MYAWTMIREPANNPVMALQKINHQMLCAMAWKMEPKQEPTKERMRNNFLP